MSEYLRRFLRDYPGIADNPHVYTVDTDYSEQHAMNGRCKAINASSTITITRLDKEATAEITLPMNEVGLFLYGLELYKMGRK